MAKVSFKYNPELVQWLKQTGAGSKWNPNDRSWDVPDGLLEELRFKADELGVDLNISGTTPITKTSDKQKTFERGYVEWEEPETSSKLYGAPSGGTGRTSPSSVRAGEGEIRLRRSRDGRFVLISMNLIAFSEDVKQLLAGEKNSVRFRVLPPRPPPQQSPNA
jgi:hypothetical protein